MSIANAVEDCSGHLADFVAHRGDSLTPKAVGELLQVASAARTASVSVRRLEAVAEAARRLIALDTLNWDAECVAAEKALAEALCALDTEEP